MLSALIQAGLIDYLMKVVLLVLPDQAHNRYREVQGAKRDAVTGILKCFEQLSVKDVKYIGWDVFATLEELIRDEAQPFAVQGLAKIALEAWDESMDGLRPRQSTSRKSALGVTDV
ncbi:hypothetical protein FRB95_002557 [Tulasnella sp. JGI-2019a]|nr:hypothetical protein FRB95_002557 [Tulasnella sp. JGI-2019a]